MWPLPSIGIGGVRGYAVGHGAFRFGLPLPALAFKPLSVHGLALACNYSAFIIHVNHFANTCSLFIK